MEHQAKSHEESNPAKIVYTCDLCEYTSNAEHSIKIHKLAAHKTIAMNLNGGQEKKLTTLRMMRMMMTMVTPRDYIKHGKQFVVNH